MSNVAAVLYRGRESLSALAGMRAQGALSNRDHLQLTADALLNASRHSPDGGYSIAYSLIHGWLKGYVETTGYIVPSALDLAAATGREDLRQDALAQGPWLLSHQRNDGSFPCIDRLTSAAFDTGQVLMGLQRLAAETGETRYGDAAARACAWMAGLSQPDGSWRGSDDTADRSPTYLTRSAGALLEYGLIANEPAWVEAGSRFLDWTMSRQLPSGLFLDSQLIAGTPYLLHTIIYVLEGLLQGYELTGERRWLEAVLRGAEPLREISLEREISLFTFYDAELKPTTSQKCLTGLSQWAGLCLKLSKITGDELYLECASNALFYVKSKQLRSEGPLRGAIPGSVPIWGDYMKLSFPNWNLKFFADALLRWDGMGLPEPRHQETFVKRSHHIYGDVVGWTAASERLSDFDVRTLEEIAAVLEPRLEGVVAPVVADLGAGGGRCLDWFAARRPDWDLVGIDPIDPGRRDRRFLVGSATKVPLPDGSADAVYCCIALQHVDAVEDALLEVRRVLKPGGVFVVFDRNPLSIRGATKPWHEIKGRWLYGWDAPFRERWRTLGQWRRLFRDAGYRVLYARASTARTAGLRGSLPINRFVCIAGQK